MRGEQTCLGFSLRRIEERVAVPLTPQESLLRYNCWLLLTFQFLLAVIIHCIVQIRSNRTHEMVSERPLLPWNTAIASACHDKLCWSY